MATFDVEGGDLVFRFSLLETLGGLRRGARVPLGEVESVEVVQEPWSVASGLRVGTGVPGVALIGTMLRRGASDVVALHGRGPAVVVKLRPGACYQRFIATLPEPSEVVARLEAASAAQIPSQGL